MQAHLEQDLQHHFRDCAALAEQLLSMKTKHTKETDRTREHNALLKWTEVGDCACKMSEGHMTVNRHHLTYYIVNDRQKA